MEMLDYFPYPEVRKGQDVFMKIAEDVINKEGNLVVHAPTGIGKTASALVPSIVYAKKNKKRVVFVTPRIQQHKIVLETIKAINKKGNDFVSVVDFVGKQKMCNMDVLFLSSSDFNSFCKHAKETKTCPFYNRMYKDGKLTGKAKVEIERLFRKNINGEELKREIRDLCPYEVTVELSKNADVIVADYYHIFHPSVRESFLKRINSKFSDIILIVDEAHNLPSRARALYSSKTSFYQMNKVKEEVKEFDEEVYKIMDRIVKRLMKEFRERVEMRSNVEFIISKEYFVDVVNEYMDYGDFLDKLHSLSDEIHEKKERSFTSGFVSFMEAWFMEDSSLVRVVEVNDKGFNINLECLDPSVITKEVFENVHSSIVMSATLIPLEMYENLLGIPDPAKLQLKSPFPKENKVSLLLDHVTTKYSMRNDKEYEVIAKEIKKISELVPGNIGVFFPSYYIRDQVLRFLKDIGKELYVEQQEMSQEQKESFIKKYKNGSRKGGVLLGVVGANFSEGVDFKGDAMNAVIVVGLPLDRPNLMTKALIDYYQNKFGKGWEYGYVYPAMNKAIQTMGRCIRSEEDKGVIVLMDYRYKEGRYRKLIPPDYEFKIIKDYERVLKEFFGNYKVKGRGLFSY